MMCGEKGLDFGRDLGPWTLQLSFKPDSPVLDEVSTSKNADPEAEGVTPVFRSKFFFSVSSFSYIEPDCLVMYRVSVSS